MYPGQDWLMQKQDLINDFSRPFRNKKENDESEQVYSVC